MLSEKEASSDDVKVSYRVTGEGEPIVLLHGFGETSEIWKNQFDAFPDHKLIIPSLPGTGPSAPATDMSMEGLAKALHAVIEKEVGTEKVMLIGHSMGGYITLAYVEKY